MLARSPGGGGIPVWSSPPTPNAANATGVMPSAGSLVAPLWTSGGANPTLSITPIDLIFLAISVAVMVFAGAVGLAVGGVLIALVLGHMLGAVV